MATRKTTVTFDDAIQEFHERLGRLSERERTHMLRMFDEYVPKIKRRSAASVQRELAEIRHARRSGRVYA